MYGSSFAWGYLLFCLSAIWGIAAWLVSAEVQRHKPRPIQTKNPKQIEQYRSELSTYRCWQLIVPTLIALFPIGFLVGHWFTLKSAFPVPPKPVLNSVALFVNCNLAEFPTTIPPGSVIHVLRVHPEILKHNRGLLDVGAPLDKERVWPSDEEAPPLPRSKNEAPGFLGMECIVRKYGIAQAVDNIVIQLDFGGGIPYGTPYRLVLDPLESQGEFGDFTFYMINCLYPDLKPGEVLLGGIPVVLANLPEKATLHVLGETFTRQVPLKVAFRDNLQRVIFLDGTRRRWPDLRPI